MKKKAFLIVLFLSLTTYHLLPSAAFAQNPAPWNQLEPGRCVIDEVATLQGFECIFINLTRILVPLAGLLLFIMLVVGSFQLLTAGGEAKALQKARGTITFAIIGLVVLLAIWFILLLIRTITGVDVTKFEIPGGLSPTP